MLHFPDCGLYMALLNSKGKTNDNYKLKFL